MASLRAIREALASTISEGLATEVFTYDTVPDVAQLPAVVVYPEKASFAEAMARGHDEWQISLYVLVPRTEYDTNQESLDSFVTGAGPDSIREAIYNDGTLGGVVIDAFVRGVEGYGGEFKTAKVTHNGAVIKVVVRTDGAT